MLYRKGHIAIVKRLLIIESGLFIGEIIHDMLKSRCADLEVRTIIQATVAEIDQAIEEFHPEIVMVDDSSPVEVLKAILLLSLRFPNLRVVVICADSNRVQVYDTQRVEVERMEDFLAVL
jgi:hypothetical protein